MVLVKITDKRKLRSSLSDRALTYKSEGRWFDFAPRQGILSTIVSLDSRPRYRKWVPGRILFLEMLQRHWLQGLKPG